MKVKIRKNVFETNSSSIHALCIGKGYDKDHLPDVINFGVLKAQEFWTAKKTISTEQINCLLVLSVIMVAQKHLQDWVNLLNCLRL